MEPQVPDPTPDAVNEPRPASNPPDGSPTVRPTKRSKAVLFRLTDVVLLVLLAAAGAVVFFIMRPEAPGAGKNSADDGRGGGGNAQQFLARLDKNKDGKITAQEAGRAWARLQASDANKDGAVTAEELANAPRQGPGQPNNRNVSRTAGAWRAMFPADVVKMDESEEVFGLSLPDGDRAYRVQAFQGDEAFVVHDLFGRTSVTIAVCPETGQARAYVSTSGISQSDPQVIVAAMAGGLPLSIAVVLAMPEAEESAEASPNPIQYAGRSKDGRMLLRVNGRFYYHDTGAAVRGGPGDKIPFRIVPLERTTWGSWKAAHPETSLYIGQQASRGDFIQVATKRPEIRNEYMSALYVLPFVPAGLMLLYMLARAGLVLAVRT